MAAGKDLTSRAIAPGSLPYGERQQLADNLPTTAPGGGAAPSAPTGVAPLPAAARPLTRLMEGRASSSGGPLSAGLSMGPGPGPMMPAAPPNPKADTLRSLADNAQSPRVRRLAQTALRRMVSRGEV